LFAAGIMAGGLGAAMPFRHRTRGPLPPRGVLRMDVPLRRPDIVLEATPPSADSPARANGGGPPAADGEPDGRRVLRPDFESLAPPPLLPADFGPSATRPYQDRRWQPVRMKLPAIAPSMRRHRVTDGDSLEALAERYLGDRNRAQEIFAANRDVLLAPDLLPLGRIIRIPSASSDDALTPAR
jgi:nucleoid-associated protein YgaU